MLNDIKYRLRALLKRDAMDRDLDDELQFHIEQEVQKHVRAGMSRSEAERRARIEFGGVEQIREDTRSVRGVTWLDSVLQDLRYAWRSAVARPGFSLAVIATLGLAIGANTTMFGVVDRLLVRAPSFLEDADRVHRVYYRYRWDGREQTTRNFAYRRYLIVRENTTSFDAMAAFATRQTAVGSGAETQELPVLAASAELFDMFSAQPVIGRFFTRDEDQVPTGRNVVVLSPRVLALRVRRAERGAWSDTAHWPGGVRDHRRSPRGVQRSCAIRSACAVRAHHDGRLRSDAGLHEQLLLVVAGDPGAARR
jgi:putative ABC transport system permease protein